MTQLDDALSIRDGRLFIEECDTTELAARFGTPLFVVSADQTRRNYRRIHTAFAQCWPEGEVHTLPAFKAAPYLALRCLLSEEGAGCDTFGEGELEGAVRGGTEPSLISVNGSVKTPEVIRRGIEIGARIVIDAPRELDLCIEQARALDRRARVLLRLKPSLDALELGSDFAPMPVRELTQRVRYGLPNNEVRPLGPLAEAAPEIELLGFHVHVGRQSTDMTLWDSLVRATVAWIAELIHEWGFKDWSPQVLDFGGGFAPPRDFGNDHHRTGQPGPPIETYAKTMTSALREAMREHGLRAEGMSFELEPGRALHSDTGLHLTRVVNVKRDTGVDARTWLEVDTTEQYLGIWARDPSTHPFPFMVASRAGAEPTRSVDIVGKSCGAEMLLLDAAVPECETGDLIALLETGAYVECLACNFNAMPRPGTVLVRGGDAEWIRRPETLDEVYARDLIPSALLRPPSGRGEPR